MSGKKIKKAFFCKNCGYQSPQWLGKCPSCQEWNTFTEEILEKPDKNSPSLPSASIPLLLDAVIQKKENRIVLPDEELNRVLGGGLVPGSVILLAGEPGIGKSTLLLQLALQIKQTTLYISGEESEYQLKLRSERIKQKNPKCWIYTETSLDKIWAAIEKIHPEILIVDSVQTLESPLLDSPQGSISQIKETTAQLIRYAKTTQTPVFIIGHITKDGSIAGPKVLEHMVDTVLQFEGDRHYIYRMVRSMKNRFGPTNELGIYEMRHDGLHPVENPSEILIGTFEESLSGVAIACTMEGVRPLLIETQALVSSAVYGTPQRSSTGFDLRRLHMLLAVLEKRCGFRLGTKDVFLNIAGGLKVDDPAIDLGVICAILSSSENIAIPKNNCFSAEIGLSGEIRPVNMIMQRIKEAEKLGFEKCFISKYNRKNLSHETLSIEPVYVAKVEDVFHHLFG